MCNPRQVLACVCCSSGFTAEPAQLTLAVVAEPLNRESPIQPAASHPAAGSQPVERNHAHHPSGGCSTGFGAGSANRCACSRHASRSARSRAIASISVVATPRDASKQGGQDRLRTLSAAARSSSHTPRANEPGRRAGAKLLTRDEARRIAANIAKPPDSSPVGLRPVKTCPTTTSL
jgi:hypothetical protein